MNLHVVAIDGPAGSGKSTVARLVAHSLGWLFLDTGAMYRALTWHLLEAGYELERPASLEHALPPVELNLNQEGRVSVCGRLLGPAELQGPAVETWVARVASDSAVRRYLREKQRAAAEQGPLVAEGRDMGSVVFPDAAWKFFLDASLACRARRRFEELRARGCTITLAEVERGLALRDRADQERKDGPLLCAPGAERIQSDALSAVQVAQKILSRLEQSEAGRA